MAKKNKGLNAAKKQNLNVENHSIHSNRTMKENLSPMSTSDILLPTLAS
jgi:hypothetical protein